MRRILQGTAMLLLGTFVPGTAWGQEAPAPSPSPALPRVRFFDRPVDLWQKGLEYEREHSSPAAPLSSPKAGPWGDLVRTESGEWRYRELPQPLVRVLEDPSRENVAGYFEWKLERARKILRAAEEIRRYRDSLGKGGASGEKAPSPAGQEEDFAHTQPAPSRAMAAVTASPAPFRLLYFHTKGCPPCGPQGEILEEWLARHPEGVRETIEFGERPELWRTHGIRGTPSLVLIKPGSSRPIKLEGLSDARALENAHRELLSPIQTKVPRGESP